MLGVLPAGGSLISWTKPCMVTLMSASFGNAVYMIRLVMHAAHYPGIAGEIHRAGITLGEQNSVSYTL